MKKSLLTLGIAFVASQSALANERPTVEAFLGLNSTDWDNDRALDGDFGIDLGLGYNLSENWAIEGWFGRHDTETEFNSMDVSVDTASINALRYLSDDTKTRPFVSFGASHSDFDPDTGNSLSDNSIDLGIGVKHYFDNNVVLRGDLIARGHEDLDDDIVFDRVARLSLGYAFGASSSPKPAAPVQAAPEPKPEVDSDQDGVFDSADKCPNTPISLKVDSMGCKLVLTETISIDLNVQFPNNSDEISDEYLSEIGRVADFMQSYSDTAVEIRGYTDDRGSAVYNQQLSEKRAKAVASKLVENFDIDSGRVSAKGFGEEDPIADNATAEGRAKNRRVVAEISAEVEKEVSKEE
jgi:OOP family OmpA-OmpF porin